MLNMTTKRTALIALIMLLSASNAYSSDKTGYSGSGELGLSYSTGNTINTSAYGALKINFSQKNYLVKSTIEAKYQSENDTQTEERYIVDIQMNRYYSNDKSYYSLIGTRFEKNKFEDIDLDSTFSLGLGKTLYKTTATQLNGEIGVGYQNTDYITKGVKSEDQVVGVAKLDLTHQINEQVSFTQDLKYTSGSTQTKIESNTGFKVKVAEKLNLKASYKYRHNDNPAPGTKKTDTQTMLTLIYDF
jgi:putative salt-induced outer membrane protein